MEQMSRLRLSGPPLALQIVGLLVGSLLVAQFVTLFLTMVLPPEPRAQYSLETIARTLTGEKAASGAGSVLQRLVQKSAPTPSGPGWLISERSRHDLAVLLGREDADVQLFFYTPLPFAGVARVPQRAAMLAPDAPALQPTRFISPERFAEPRRHRLPRGFMYADYQVAAAGAGGGFPGGGFPGGFPGGGFPGAGVPGGSFPGGMPFPRSNMPPMHPESAPFPQSGSGPMTQPAAPSQGTQTGPLRPGGDMSGTGPQNIGGARMDPGAARGSSVYGGGGAGGFSAPGSLAAPGSRLVAPNIIVSEPVAPDQFAIPLPQLPRQPREGERRVSSSVVQPANRVPETQTITAPTPSIATAEEPSQKPKPAAVAQTPTTPVLVPPAQKSLFGLVQAPFVEGDFVAALRLADGQWAVVQPQPEPFPNSWQKRLLLWFFLSASLVAPVGWLFARRLVRPIAGFAYAAEQLGRDPTASVLALEGPAEVGRAASAFNRMQSRLKSFVDDRTAMVGAISHDLRTPLTRLRFRLEDVPDGQREGMLAEVDEMEQMISSVLAFIRDASEPGARVKIDLRSIVEDVVEDAVFIGKPVTLEETQLAPVEVDPLGMRRLLGNLVENAVKYGDSAKVRLFTDHQDAVAEVIDNGPGLPDDELERVFQPFYRAPQARASAKHGTGLGLAVCRSIARAHGGDVHLMRGDQGLVAQLRLPLAYGATAV